MYSDTFASTDAYEASRSQARPIPSFLKSLYSIVNDGSTGKRCIQCEMSLSCHVMPEFLIAEDIISWNSEGTSFTIHGTHTFSDI
jgi:hypothetical protein